MEHQKQPQDDGLGTLDVKRYLSLIWHNIWIVAVGVFVVGIGVFLYYRSQPSIYEAKTQVIVTRSNNSTSSADMAQSMNSQQLGQTYVEILNQRWALDEVALRIGSRVSQGNIHVSSAANSLVINIRVEDQNPERAKKIADTLVQVLIDQNTSIQNSRYSEAEVGLSKQIQQIKAQISEAQTRLDLALNEAQDAKQVDLLNKISNTQDEITKSEYDLKNLQAFSKMNINTEINKFENNITKLEGQLTVLNAELTAVNEQIATNPRVTTDAQYSAFLHQLKTDKEDSVNDLETEIQSNREQITTLEPYLVPGYLQKSIQEVQGNIDLQKNLLGTYQNLYSDLLTNASGKAVNSTDVNTLQQDLDLYQKIYLNLLSSQESIRLDKIQNMPDVIQVNSAFAGNLPVKPRIRTNTYLGGLAGLLLALIFIFTRNYFDNTLKTKEEIERLLNAPILGYILKIENYGDGLAVSQAPRSPVADAFRALRTNMDFLGVDKPVNRLMVSSPGASEGKTTVAANLAAIIAQNGKKVVLVDADLRRPRIHKLMNIHNRVGLTDVLLGRMSLNEVIQQNENSSISLVTSGPIPPNPAELLSSHKMEQVLTGLDKLFDVVIIDSTPSIIADCLVVAAKTDGVLLVIWPGKTSADQARNAIEQYQQAGAKVLGLTLNNIEPGRSYRGYKYFSSKKSYYQYNDVEPQNAYTRLMGTIKGLHIRK